MNYKTSEVYEQVYNSIYIKRLFRYIIKNIFFWIILSKILFYMTIFNYCNWEFVVSVIIHVIFVQL